MADSRRRYESLAGLMIAAGVNAKALSTYMGHTSVAMTLDRYGHLMPGSEAERRKPPRRLPRPLDWRAYWRAHPLTGLFKREERG
jgi:integrase